MSTPPETLGEFMAELDRGADVVIGNRKSREARIERWQPPIRIWLGLGFTWLANSMTGLSINDYTCGFKLFRGQAARKIFEAIDTPGWSFDVEVLARAARDDLVVREIPVRWSHVDGTRVRLVRDVVRSFVELLAIRRRVGGPRRRA
jgi:dolichyl-phosphate beta-glucosyltransferase